MGSSNENSAYGPVRNPVGDRSRRPADRAAARPPRWPRSACRSRSGPTPADRSASPRRSAASSGSSRPTAACRGTACWRSPRRSIRSARSHDGRRCRGRAVGTVRPRPDGLDLVAEAVPDFAAALTGDIRGVRVGVPRAFVAEGVDDAVRRAFDAALDVLRDAGATLVDIELPHARYAIPVILPDLHGRGELEPRPLRRREVRLPLARREGRTLKTMYSRTSDEGFGAEVKRRIMLGTYVLSAGYYDAFYLKAQQVRTLLRRDYEQAFDAGRRRRHADQPDSAVQARREDGRPAADVSRRHLHGQREPRRAARHQHSVRLHERIEASARSASS